MLCDDPSMGGARSFQLLRIAGIRIGVDASWFVILFLLIFLLHSDFRQALSSSSDTTAYVTSVIAALLFFLSILLHELGHAFAARREGIGVTGIDLFLFGGLMKMSRDTDSPGAEFKVAAAGPLVTLLLAVLFLGLGAALAGGIGEAFDAARLREDADASPVALVLTTLASANVFLLAFNLVPAFPLDGGRIARAIVWKATGNRAKATRAAAFLGQAFSFVLIGYGIYLALNDQVFSGIWIAVLGYMLGQSARGAIMQSAVSERLGGVTVGDVMDAEPVSIPADTTALRAYEDFFLRYGAGWDAFPVVEPDGRMVGVAHRESIRQAAEGASELPVRRLITAGEDGTVAQRATLEEMIGHAGMRAHGILGVVDEEGRLRGTVSREQVVKALQARLSG